MKDTEKARKSRVIVALDVPRAADIKPLVTQVPNEIEWYKVGLELFISEGHEAIQILTDMGKQIFLDLKLHDIPRTVAHAVNAAASHGVGLLTIHATGGRAMLTAAAEAAAAAGTNQPKLLAITTLTSLDQQDLTDIGVQRQLTEQTLELGKMAVSCGIDGLVCSPLEVSQFREALGESTILVTPGVRPAGAELGDQKRVSTPAEAVRAGSNFLVIGRPIVKADDPGAAARAILAEMAGAG